MKASWPVAILLSLLLAPPVPAGADSFPPGYDSVEEEGTLVTPRRRKLNFVGSGVTVTDDAVNKETDITISGVDTSDLGDVTGTNVTVTSISDQEVVWSDDSTLAGDPDFTINPTTNVLTIGGASIGSTGQRAYGSTSFIDFNDGGSGTILFGASNGTFNESLKLDLEVEADRAVLTSPSGVEDLNWAETLTVTKLIAGGLTLADVLNAGRVLVSFYKLDDNAASTAVADEQGVNAGTASVNTSTLSATGKLGNGFTLTGTETVDLGTSDTLKMTGDFAVELWMNTTTVSKRVAGNRSATGSNIGWELALTSGGKLSFIVDPGVSATATSTTTMTNGAWHHVIAQRDGNLLEIWVNGVRQDTAAISGDNGTGADRTYLGRSPFLTTLFVGTIDNVRIYDGALTDDEIAFLYSDGTGTEALAFEPAISTAQIIADEASALSNHGLDQLRDLYVQGQFEVDEAVWFDDTVTVVNEFHVGEGTPLGAINLTSVLAADYRMEDSAANTTVTDSVGSFNCTASRNTSNWTVSGILSNGFGLTSASSDYADCGSSATLKFSGDFSVEFWMKTATTGRKMRIMGNRSPDGNNRGYEHMVLENNKVRCAYDLGSTYAYINSSTTVTDNAWHHVVCVRDDTTLKLYVDGASEGTQTAEASGSLGSSSQIANTYIGRVPCFDDFYYNGSLDNVRLYSRALAALEVDQLYNSGTGTVASSFSNVPLPMHFIGDTSTAALHISTLNDLLLQGSLETRGSAFVGTTLVLDPQAVTVASNGAGTPATSTLTATKSYVNLTCNDTHGCTMTLSESGAVDGQLVEITNVSANAATFAVSSGVFQAPATVTLNQWESLALRYVTDRWVKINDDGSTSINATTSVSGLVVLATVAETSAGTDTFRAVTPDGLAGSTFGTKGMILKLDTETTAITTGDSKFCVTIPVEISGMNVVSVGAHVYTTSSSGTPTWQLRNATDTTDVLSTKLTIDAGELDSSTAATAAVINTSTDDVGLGEVLCVDKDGAGTGEKGDEIRVGFRLP